MKAFADLFAALDDTGKTAKKTQALVEYFSTCDPASGAWAVYFLIGRKPKRLVASRKLAAWAIAMAGIGDWLFDESYEAVGDLAETIALLLPRAEMSTCLPLHEWVESRLLGLRGLDESDQMRHVQQYWRELNDRQRFVWNKFLTGGFRVGVSQQLVTRALAQVTGVDPAVIAHRLMGAWEPTVDFFVGLVSKDAALDDLTRPYPFLLAHPLEGPPESLGAVDGWQAEWKWDGIRTQMIRRAGGVFLWSRGEENVTEQFPEIAASACQLPAGVVLDGEVLPWLYGQCLPFAQLQRRIGRKSLGKKILAEVPAAFLAYDLLERDGVDGRALPLAERRSRLESIINASGRTGVLQLSPVVPFATWDDLAAARNSSRQRNVEGIMLKRLDAPYRSGRTRGDWWKWKIDPLTVDAVLIYAQAGHGKRASLYSDYTFGVWDNGRLVSFAKAYSGLTDAEIREVDNFVRKNTLEKFGPVRTVKPELVFELAFEGIQRSSRHKSGIAVRFPRMLRWRKDKAPTEADSLDRIQRMLNAVANISQAGVSPPP